MILSDGDIRRRLEAGDLVIEPLDDPDLQIQPASVDFRLGRTFLEFNRTNIPCIHPDRADEVSDYVSETRVPPTDQATLGGYDTEPAGAGGAEGVEQVNDQFILHPGDFVLGTTIERVEIPHDLIAHVEGRSSLGRLAVVVHASLPYDEQVFLWTPEDGYGFHEIGDVVENRTPARAVAFDPETLRVRTHEVTDYITNPAKRIYRVTLRSGRQVHVTKDHNLFTIDDHGEVVRVASEDAEGTRVMVPDSLPEPSVPEAELDLLALFDGSEEVIAYASDGVAAVDWTDDVGLASRRHDESRRSAPLATLSRSLAPGDVEVAFKHRDARLPRHIPVTPELGWVLGFYIAEGSAGRNQLQFVTDDRAYLERVASWFERYDASLDWDERPSSADTLTVCSALWSKLFRALAGAGREKNVPDRAWNWSDDVLAALLEGLVDGIGSRPGSRDTPSTSNPGLADRTMYLAARLGVLNSAYPRQREPFMEQSGGTARGTQWDIDLAEEAHQRGQYLPVPGELLRTVREQAGLGVADVAEAAGDASKSSITNVENHPADGVQRSTLHRLREVYGGTDADTSRLDRLLDGDVRFEQVVSVEETDRVETTYDLEVQPAGRTIENFIGGRGGVFLSNTAGIVDPGYRGQITLELSNLGSAPVALKPGMRISQLTFTELKTPAERPYGAERGSKYQDQAGPQASRIQGDEEFRGDR